MAGFYGVEAAHTSDAGEEHRIPFDHLVYYGPRITGLDPASEKTISPYDESRKHLGRHLIPFRTAISVQ